jgi:hypothetical protein
VAFGSTDKTAYRLPQATCNALLDQRDADIDQLLQIYDCTSAACHYERVQLYADIDSLEAQWSSGRCWTWPTYPVKYPTVPPPPTGDDAWFE